MSIATSTPVRLDWSGRRAEAWSWLPVDAIEPETLQQVRDIGSLDVAVRVGVRVGVFVAVFVGVLVDVAV